MMDKQELEKHICEKSAQIAKIILRGKDCEIRKSKDGISIAEISKKVINKQ